MVGTVAIYVCLFSYNSLTRTRRFSPDSMNYVDVARHISSGDGIVQSTLGFNQPLLFSPHSRIPTPLVSQPPLYPLLISLVSRSGISETDAALLIPAAAYGLVLFLVYRLTRSLYGEHAGLLAIAALLIHQPLNRVSRAAWSESLGLSFVLFSLYLLSMVSPANGSARLRLHAICAGLAAGCAFGVRYALLPLSLLGALSLVIQLRHDRSMYRAVLLYLFGAGVPIVLVLLNHLISTGLLMPMALPSTRPLSQNAADAISALFGSSLPLSDSATQTAVTLMAMSLSVIVFVFRRRTHELMDVLSRDRRYLATAWVLSYSAFIVAVRTVSHFDPINERMMVPASVVALPVGGALLVQLCRPRLPSVRVLCGVAAMIAITQAVSEARSAMDQPRVDHDEGIVRGDRLDWIAEHTTDDDLIVGDLSVDIPFYLRRRAAVSFSSYPYTIHLTYDALTEFADYNCLQYRRIYLILRSRAVWQHSQQVEEFGTFIADVRDGNLSEYSRLVRVPNPNRIPVFEVLCR